MDQFSIFLIVGSMLLILGSLFLMRAVGYSSNDVLSMFWMGISSVSYKKRFVRKQKYKNNTILAIGAVVLSSGIISVLFAFLGNK